MRSDQGSVFAGTMMEEVAQTRLRHILERPEAPQDDAGNFKKLKDAYNACLDESTIRERGIQPLVEVLAKLQSIYPANDETTFGTEKNITDAILFLIQSNVQALVSPSVSVRPPDSILVQGCTNNYSLMIGILITLLFL
jgi:endothelin-converting enzyme